MPRPRAFLLLAAVPLFAAALLLARSDSPTAGGEASPAGEARPLAASAQKAWIDPETGRLATPTADELEIERQLAPPNGALSERLRVDAEGLWEEPSAAGGYRVDLRGRFASSTVATVSPDGRIVTRCVPAGVEGDEEDGS